MEQIILLAVITGAIAYFSKGLKNIFSTLFSIFVTKFEVHSSNVAYDYYLDFFEIHKHKFINNLRFSYITNFRDRENRGKWYNTIGYGWHLIKYKNTFILLYQFKQESMYSVYWENATIWAYSLNKKIFNEITDILYKEAQGHSYTKVYLYDKNWAVLNTKSKRPLDTVFWDKDLKKDFVEDIKTFIKSKKSYIKSGIPYKRSYLFYGEPGTGKTTMINAIAGELNLNVSILNLSTMTNDSEMLKAFSTVPNKSILVLEDIDLIFQKLTENTEKSDKNLITFSGLLNSLDGISYKEGLITILTTNHIERLDEAVLRVGRIDKKIEIGKISKETAKEIIKKFNKPENELSGLEFPINPSKLLSHLKIK